MGTPRKNACAHLKLVKQLRSGLQYAELLKVLESIRVLYKEKNNTTNWNLCKACGFKLLCPHVDMLIQLQAAEASYDTMRTKLMKFSGINKEKENNQGLFTPTFAKFVAKSWPILFKRIVRQMWASSAILIVSSVFLFGRKP